MPDLSLLRPPHNVLINLFLAAVPVALAFFIARGIRGQMRATGRVAWLLWTPLLLFWLVFLPNTCYLLTEWRHYLETITASPVYYQAKYDKEAIPSFLLLTAFYVMYSGSGLLLFFLAVWPLDRLTRRRLGRWVWPTQALIFIFCALGVYLGLLPRFNSKDIFHLHRLQDIVVTALDTLTHPLLLTLILGFSALLWLLYALFDIWMDGAALRLHLRRPQTY